MEITARADLEAVTELLGRPPLAKFEVVLRSKDGRPSVISNSPITDAGLPMPTRWWLVERDLVAAVSRLEAAGGVKQAEAEVDETELLHAHAIYARQRDRELPPNWSGPRPSGGVGGTRVGVKCLHAHYAWHLVGGDDPVGRWVSQRLQDGDFGLDIRG